MIQSLYPEELKKFHLSFEEAIITIVFDLEDDLCTRGKVVFAEFGDQQRLEAAVAKVLSKMWQEEARDLKLVLGNLDLVDMDESYDKTRLEDTFRRGLKNLNGKISWRHKNYRYLLAREARSYAWREVNAVMTDRTVANSPSPANSDTEVDGLSMASLTTSDGNLVKAEKSSVVSQTDINTLCSEVYQLMAEVREYDKKIAEICKYNEWRDRALSQIEKLMTVIASQSRTVSMLTNVSEGRTAEVSDDELSFDRSVAVLGLPYRSNAVVANLGLKTVADVMAYFRDFRNFVEADNRITLLEWWVIQQVLYKNERDPGCGYRLFDDIRGLDLSARVLNCLRRYAGGSLAGLAAKFVNGAAGGWNNVRRMKGFGAGCLDELIAVLRVTPVVLDDDVCFLTEFSPVLALDFDGETLDKLETYQIKKIGQLLTACRDANRFTGLRYVDKSLYQSAVERLERYGFNI